MALSEEQRQTIREELARLNDETLLEQVVEQRHEFEPEALALREEELERRGVSRETIAGRREQADRARRGPLVPAAAFANPAYAEQARDLLDQHQISALVEEHHAMDANVFPLPSQAGGWLVRVPEADKRQAELVLEELVAIDRGRGQADRAPAAPAAPAPEGTAEAPDYDPDETLQVERPGDLGRRPEEE